LFNDYFIAIHLVQQLELHLAISSCPMDTGDSVVLKKSSILQSVFTSLHVVSRLWVCERLRHVLRHGERARKADAAAEFAKELVSTAICGEDGYDLTSKTIL
jgi:hypothetical protein